ncbi:MAG: GAF/FHA/SpoE domain-containing protein [Acidobacteria bacterium OLB17]|nr:MAG: GAF/FHA/SpoE domain-containing protein [Acidobacteria bacterium OLB17]MCZ2391034.1 DUF5715 family protein [Acidobacteriota bacterium]
MKPVKLHIDAPDGARSIALDEELSIGRTPESDIVIADSGLSRRNTSIFRDGDDVLIVDERSTNGTFLNGEKLDDRPRIIRDGDTIRIGSSTTIRVEAGGTRTAETPPEQKPTAPVEAAAAPPPTYVAPETAPSAGFDPTRILLIGAVAFTLLIVLGAGAALLFSRESSPPPSNGNAALPTPKINTARRIPLRVIDPLGDQNEDDLDDLIASWETAEKEVDASTIADVTVGADDAAEADLNVPASLLADRQKKALEPRNAETGIRPAGLDVPKELYGDGVIKQKAKLREMKADGYHQPLDFPDLAEKRLNKELIEMPMAAQSYYLDVGGSASDGPFQSFAFPNVHADLVPGSQKMLAIGRLADNFAGHKYDLNNPADRKQMRIRLLRMFNPRAKKILLDLAEAYYKQFNRPLRVTSLTRSMDYQIGLNATNVNSFKVRDENALPPHTSGCAFDLARKHMTAAEQNFVMKELAAMENENKLDALIEYGQNACFHVFIYFDGLAPKM